VIYPLFVYRFRVRHVTILGVKDDCCLFWSIYVNHQAALPFIMLLLNRRPQLSNRRANLNDKFPFGIKMLEF